MLKLLFSFLLRADKKEGDGRLLSYFPRKKRKRLATDVVGGLYGPKRFFSFCGSI